MINPQSALPALVCRARIARNTDNRETMDFIPIEPDENLESILDSVGNFPFTLVEINHLGDYEN